MEIRYDNLRYDDIDQHLRRLRGRIVPGQRVKVEDNIEFSCLDLATPGHVPNVEFSGAPTYRNAFDQWVLDREKYRDWPIGYFTLHDVTCIGSDCAIVDTKRGKFFTGHSIGWSGHYADWSIGRHGTKVEGDNGTFTIATNGEIEDRHRALVMGGPGFNIFGHQLFDYLPRSELTQHHDIGGGFGVLRGDLPTWAASLTAPLRQTQHDSIMTTGRHLRVKELRVPTLLKYGAWTDARVTRKTIRRIRDHHEIGHGFTMEKVCVSRSQWPHNRRTGSDISWDQYFVERGFNIVHPQDLDIPTQITIFSGAKHFGGVDGSGLHGMMFSDDPQSISIVHVERVNPLHFAAASLFKDLKIKLIDADAAV